MVPLDPLDLQLKFSAWLVKSSATPRDFLASTSAPGHVDDLISLRPDESYFIATHPLNSSSPLKTGEPLDPFFNPTMIEEILEGMTPGRAALWALGIFTAILVFRKIQVSAQLSRLGARAPKIHFRLPYGANCHRLQPYPC